MNTVNPFLARRSDRPPCGRAPCGHDARHAPHDDRPVYARLPKAPITASPVPRLTSLYHHEPRGDWGDRRYPGNCSGHLIRDLVVFFGATTVFDPMTGSGTCRDVCNDLGVECVAGDVRHGFDATDAKQVRALAPADGFDLVWAHPPYWRQKVYTTDPRDLSRAATLDAFLAGYERLIRNLASVLAQGGRLAVLMGDYTDRVTGFVPLTYHTKRLAFEAGLRQRCTDIVRFGHGATSGHKTYYSSFIPGLHDLCMVFER